MKTVVLSISYTVCWSLIPVLDKLALHTAKQHALTWAVFFICFLCLSTYVLIFTESAPETISVALHTPYTFGSGVLTAIVYLVYFALLQESGVTYIVVLQPVITILQAALGILMSGMARRRRVM